MKQTETQFCTTYLGNYASLLGCMKLHPVKLKFDIMQVEHKKSKGTQEASPLLSIRP
jgi:hypothetical protein